MIGSIVTQVKLFLLTYLNPFPQTPSLVESPYLTSILHLNPYPIGTFLILLGILLIMEGRYQEEIDDNLEVDDALLEEMPGISNISPYLTGQQIPDTYRGQSAAVVLKDLHKVQQGKIKDPQSQTSAYQDFDYERYGYDSAHDPQFSACNPLNCHPMTEFDKIASLMKIEDDPVSTNLLSLIQTASSLNSLDINLLINEYRLLTRVASVDWMLIRIKLSEACRAGYNSFLNMMIGMATVYQLQHAKAMNDNMEILGSLVDQFKLQTSSFKKQMEMDKSFQENLTKQLNGFTRGIADATERIETKTLELSRPTPKMTPASNASPSADSVSSHQTPFPGQLQIHPYSTYKSECLIVTFGVDAHISVQPTRAEFGPLTNLATLKIAPKALVGILNQDHRLLLSQLKRHPQFVRDFNSEADRGKRILLLQTTFGTIPDREDQWIHNPTQFT